MENISEIIQNYLKENLRIECTTSVERGHGENYTSITIVVFLGDEKISSSSDNIWQPRRN